MRILINVLSAKMGGAATYLREIATAIGKGQSIADFVFLTPPEQAEMVRSLAPNAKVITSEIAHARAWSRLWFDQVTLRKLLRDEKVDVVYSTNNFGMLACPCRQVLFVHNSIYFNRLYQTRFRPERHVRTRLNLALRKMLISISIRSADLLITPSQTMLDEILKQISIPPERTLVNHHGINRDRFAFVPLSHQRNEIPVLLFTSLYTEYKNLGTVLRALRLLAADGVKCKLVTTASPEWEIGPRTQTRDADTALFREMTQNGLVEFPGVVKDTADLYRRGDVFVYPSVVESFGHPLVEAMACGLPIVAADVPINRELCQDAALYFGPFDSSDCARKIQALLQDPQLRLALVRSGESRVNAFCWEKNVNRLLTHLGVAVPSQEPTYV